MLLRRHQCLLVHSRFASRSPAIRPPTTHLSRPYHSTVATSLGQRQQQSLRSMTNLLPTQDRPINVLLIGLGSIGSIYSWMLERTGKVRVTAVARSNYDLYTHNGVTIETDQYGKQEGWRPYRVVRSQAEALEGDVFYDYCMITTKCLPDIVTTPELVKEVIASKKVGAWSLLQNGLGVEEDLYKATKHLDQPIVSSCLWVGIMTTQKGALVTWRGKDVSVSGLYPPLNPVDSPQTRTFSPQEQNAIDVWHSLLKEGGANIFIEDRIDSIRYLKNIVNCTWSSIEGLILGTSEVYENTPPEDIQPMKDFVREIVETGFKAGLLREGMLQYPGMGKMADIDTTAESVWSFVHNMAIQKSKQGIPPHKMSLLVDIENGKPFEVEVITGSVLRTARAHGLDTPRIALIYCLMKGLQANIIGRQKARQVAAAPVTK